MPNALMEAMVMGLPCISTDCPCGGPSDLIRNNEDGILIPVNDKNALVNALEYMIDNPEKAKQMGKNAMDIRKRLSVDSVCSMWYAYFNNKN
jgi:glycosyltransferase involved in cell wall biosynthesis